MYFTYFLQNWNLDEERKASNTCKNVGIEINFNTVTD
jgi:hypothetical protein